VVAADPGAVGQVEEQFRVRAADGALGRFALPWRASLLIRDGMLWREDRAPRVPVPQLMGFGAAVRASPVGITGGADRRRGAPGAVQRVQAAAGSVRAFAPLSSELVSCAQQNGR
jgi:hypothetical protein